MTVFWQGKDITNKPTLIYYDDLQTVRPPVPMLVNPDGNGGLLCNSTVGRIAWHPGDGSTNAFDINQLERFLYQIIPTGSTTMAQMVTDGRSANDVDVSDSSFHNGLFTCRRNGDISTAVPVGLYQRSGRRVRGVITRPVISITSSSFIAASPSFTLAGDTEEGPPETYNWTRNGAPITNNNSFSISIGVNGVTDPSAYDNSRYRSTLTVTETLPGVYQYSVSNRATPNTLTSSINIEGAGATAPINLVARQNGVEQNGVGPVLVSWTLPSLRPVDGYQISTQSPPDFSASIDVGRDVSSRTINLAQGTHSISIRARFQHYPGMVVGPVTVAVLAFERPIIMPPSVIANSVTLSWAQPEGTLPSENYTISLERGTNQPFCSDETDSRQMTTNDQSVVFSNLYGSSSYTATVTATAFGTSMMMSQDFMTLASRSPPIGVPQRIIPSMTSRTITVNWDEITCRERNGAITNYLVELKKEGVGEPIPGMLMINEMRFFADGSQIIPFTNYTFRMAGRNMQGQGPYSEIMTILTMEDTPGPVSLLRSKVRFTSIDITWDRPRQPNGIILRYEITYTVNDNISPITNTTTNPKDTITFNIPALTLGTRVSVSVRAYTSVGQGPPINLTNLVTLTEPPVVTNVLVASVNATSVIVSWDRIDIMEITSYTVYYSAIGSMNDELNVTVPSSQNSVVIGNLQSGVEYRFVVDAVAMLSRVGNIRGQRSGISHPSASQNCGRDLSIAVVVSILLTIITYTAIMLVVLCVCLRKKKNGNGTGKEDTYVAPTDNSFRMSGQEEMDMKACMAYAQFPSTQTPASHEGAEALYDNV